MNKTMPSGIRHALCALLAGTVQVGAAVPDDLPVQARQRFGESGARAAAFLLAHMPAGDRAQLSADFIHAHLGLALAARAEFPWAAAVPEPLFHNDVVSYAVFDEPRETWRADFLARSRPLVADCRTATEAVQALNRALFKDLGVHYHTGRRAPNQSASESLALGKASCSGLSILLVYACRAIGIPARAVGTPLWANGSGNHTWVEVWDGGWHFTGADEYDPDGLDRGWFVDEAARARADLPEHAIYATSWGRTGTTFPLVWAPTSTQVNAEPVTARYARATPLLDGQANLGLRLSNAEGERLLARIRVLDAAGVIRGEVATRAGTSDLNDVPRLVLPAGTSGLLRLTHRGVLRELPFGPLTVGDSVLDLAWEACRPVFPTVVADLSDDDVLAPLIAWLATPAAGRKREAAALATPLGRSAAERARGLLASDRLRTVAERSQEALRSRNLTHAGKTMRWLESTFGTAPPTGASLWISLHGGGGAPAEVNDQQWRNQARLYEPKEGIYLAPRAPTDTWNLWHEEHIDHLLAALIDSYVAARGVDPDRVYLMGYSAGGDGVWQLAPRMADRFAAAAMMAGHPNEASLLGLRNLPFAIFMGGMDSAYERNRIATERAAELGRLRLADPDGYEHLARIYPGLGHWMDRRDAEALPWMAKHGRRTWPKRVVWLQDDVLHQRLYWLSWADAGSARVGQKLIATVDKQQIAIDCAGGLPGALRLHLGDDLVDLDQPVVVQVNGTEVWRGVVPRTAGVLVDELDARPDVRAAACAVWTLAKP